MDRKYTCAVVLILVGILASTVPVAGGDWGIGLGLSAGISRLEGDIRSPKISPIISGHLNFYPVPYFGVGGNLGYSRLSMDGHPIYPDLKTTIIPFELNAIFNFLPGRTANPFILVGGGGTYWKAENAGAPIIAGGKNQDGIDSFLKTSAGVEFRLSSQFSLSLTGTYRYSLTDALDQLWQGDENDQVLDLQAGFTYYFNTGKADRDHDAITDDRDLMPEIAEDRDGFLDHDGIPEKNPIPTSGDAGGLDFENSMGSESPMVIHYLLTNVEAGNDVDVRAEVYSKVPLKIVATIYRPLGAPNWSVINMLEVGTNAYECQIPGYAVTTPGLEYCVVAVDETTRGIGYSGLPSKPIQVKVAPRGTTWRIVGGIVGAAAIGTATYLVIRKQN